MSVDSNESTTSVTEEQPERRSLPRSPLLIGVIAYGILCWMLFVVLALIAWRLTGG